MKLKTKVICEDINKIINKSNNMDNLGFLGAPTTLSNFYIEKNLGVKKVKSDLITIKKSDYEDYYAVNINLLLYKRISKIYKLTKNEKYFKILEHINYLFSKRTETEKIFERYLSEELSKEIDRLILKEVIKRGK